MPRFYHPDDLPQRHPTEMQVMVNTLHAIGIDGAPRDAFVCAHLSDLERSNPAILASLWEADGVLAMDDDLVAEGCIREHLAWTVSLSPDQARALGWALLRLADGLDTMAEMGELDPEELSAHGSPIYWSEPSL